MAHKKGMGSMKNGRDSEGKRLGAKRADGQFVLAGNILSPVDFRFHIFQRQLFQTSLESVLMLIMI